MAQTLIGPAPFLVVDASENGNTLVLKKNVTIEEGVGTAIDLGGAAADLTLKVNGKVKGNAEGVSSAAEQSKIVIGKSGVVKADAKIGTGLTVEANDTTEVVNKGYISGANGAIVDVGAADFLNEGVIMSSGLTGIALFVASDNGVATNTGVIQSRYIGIQDAGANNTLVNEGSIWAAIGVYTVSGSSTLENLGDIHASVIGQYLADATGSTAENAGLIKSGSYAVFSIGDLTYLNTGTLKGEDGVFVIGSGFLDLTNRGKIVGDIQMTGDADTFLALGKGVVKGQVRGGEGDDTMTGNKKKDHFIGQEGEDVLSGEGGKDRLLGGDDDDTLDGGTGDDILKGGTHNDILDGGRGDDNLFGGNGTDFFQFSGARPGDDVIHDFVVIFDRIDLSGYGLNAAEIDAVMDGIDYGAERTVIDLSVIDGVKGSVTLEGFYYELVVGGFVF